MRLTMGVAVSALGVGAVALPRMGLGGVTAASLRAAVAAGSVSRGMRAAPSPVAMVPVAPLTRRVAGLIATRMSLLRLARIDRRLAILRGLGGRGGRATGCRRIVRAGLVAMGGFGSAVGRPTAIVMALIGQGLWPFLMEGQDKPH